MTTVRLKFEKFKSQRYPYHKSTHPTGVRSRPPAPHRGCSPARAPRKQRQTGRAHARTHRRRRRRPLHHDGPLWHRRRAIITPRDGPTPRRLPMVRNQRPVVRPPVRARPAARLGRPVAVRPRREVGSTTSVAVILDRAADIRDRARNKVWHTGCSEGRAA